MQSLKWRPQAPAHAMMLCQEGGRPCHPACLCACALCPSQGGGSGFGGGRQRRI